jgi:hypothetical protein
MSKIFWPQQEEVKGERKRLYNEVLYGLYLNRREQTVLAQVPEETLVQKQLTLQPSRLIVSSCGLHESCNRTYGKTAHRILFG